MIGTQRSGSNLLRLVLNQSDAIVSPHPAHLLTNFLPLMSFYQPLDPINYKKLVNDAIAYIAVNPVEWDMEFDVDELVSMAQEYSLFELNKNIYEYLARSGNATMWCCKSMSNVYYAPQIETNLPDVKYLYLYRDGRDVALSFQKAIVGEKHIYHIAKQWHEDQQACLKLMRSTAKERIFCLNYESLTSEFESTIKELCSFLQIRFEDRMLDFYKSPDSEKTARGGKMWNNLTKPLIKDNTKKYLKEMSLDDLKIFESVAGQSLKDLGYGLTFSEAELLHFSADDIATFDVLNKQMKIHIKQEVGEEDLKKRQGQLDIIAKIKNYESKSVTI